MKKPNILPIPFTVTDDFVLDHELKELNACWPDKDWPGWVHYNPLIEGKRGSDVKTPIPAVCANVLHKMAMVASKSKLAVGSVLDLSLHGGGLHESVPGDHVGLHLDADTHPRLGLTRTLSAILYVHRDWKLNWGGELEFWNNPPTYPLIRVNPLPGRLVIFATNDTSWHSVNKILAPDGVTRRSLAMFGYGVNKGSNKRPRAHFVQHPNKVRSSEVEEAILARRA